MEYKYKFQVVVFVYLLTLLFIGNASSATLYVEKNGAGNYTTIQEAINNARDGDTVYVYNEKYYEHVTVDKRITLKGEDRFRTVIDGSGSGSCIYVTADGSKITGFKVQNGRYGIYLCSVSDCVVDSNVFVDNREGDIFSDNSVHNIIINNLACSIYVDKGKNTVYDNTYLNITSYNPSAQFLSIKEGESLDFSVKAQSSSGRGSILYEWTLDGKPLLTSDAHWPYEPDYNTVMQGGITKTVNVTVTVSDENCEVTKKWKVEVKGYNPPPTIAPSKSEPRDRPPCIKEGEFLEFSVIAEDPDRTTPRYKWTLEDELVKNYTYNSWTYWPEDTDIGTKIVKVTAIDREDDKLTDSYEWVVKICNRRPTIDSVKPNTTTPSVEVEEGKSLIFSVTARDPEGSSLIYKWILDDEKIPTSKNYWVYSPNYTDSGKKIVNLTVSDGMLTSPKEWTVEVINVNQKPIIHSSSPKKDIVNMSYNDSMTFCVDASDYDDPDGEKLTYTWTLDGKRQEHTTESFNFSPKDYLDLDNIKDVTIVTLVLNVSDNDHQLFQSQKTLTKFISGFNLRI